MQHLSWVVWYKSNDIVTDDDISTAIDDLLEQNKVFFQKDVEQLSELQYNFLRAMAMGVTTGFSTKDVVRQYRLESSANVQAVKKAEQTVMIKSDLNLVSFI